MFILTIATDYEGETVLGVYSSESLAYAACAPFLRSRGSQLSSYEQFRVREIEVDARAEYHW